MAPSTREQFAASIQQLPPLLDGRRICAVGHCSMSTVDRAVNAGELPPPYRVGGRGKRMWRTEDVLRWLAGDVGEQVESAPARKPIPAGRTADVAPALARIKRAAKGGAK